MPEGRIYTLTLTVEALSDLDRLDIFLRPINPPAADRFQDVIWEAFNVLLDTPRLGVPWPEAPPGQDIRQHYVGFGKRGYVVRYEIAGFELIVARIYHFLEDRSSDH
ncbi:MAG: type II toxin-antitoxin system RelE/ParE family toxin [Geminicoccaceae bacterium]